MKHIKHFKLFETGEWNSDIDWDYVKEHPDDDSEESSWIKLLNTQLEYMIDNLDDPTIFKIIDIIGFDMYQGPYAIIEIFNKRYKLWNIEENNFWIDNFPIDNTSQNGGNAGFEGTWNDISSMVNEITESGGIEVYMNTKKYNL